MTSTFKTPFAPIRRVLVRRPDASFAVDDPAAWNYAGRPDVDVARKEHDVLTERLRSAGAEVVDHDVAQPGRADAIFVTDPALMTSAGAVILSPGKAARRGEEEALAGRLQELGVPIAGRLEDEERAEGGDCLWLDETTLMVGRSFRTNDAGIAALRRLLGDLGVEVLAADLPYFEGPHACLHLLSMISMIDADLAVAYLPLLPVAVYRELERRGVEIVEVVEAEFFTMAPNVLALGSRRGLMLEGNPETRRRLEAVGCEILTYPGRELSLKAEGGPTCLTLPLERR